MTKKFSGCEIAEIGIQIEKNGKEFYNELVRLADSAEMKTVFKLLSEAEERHIGIFRRMFDSSCEYNPGGAYTDDYFAYMNALAGQYVFTRKDRGTEVARAVKNFSEGLDLGIRFEKDSILLYREFREIVPEEDRPLVDELIAEEKDHLRQLLDLKKGYKT